MHTSRPLWSTRTARYRSPSLRFGLASCGILLLLGCSNAPDAELEPPARIILFSMDTVRADLVSGYGESGNTPVLAEIASEGVLFQNSYAASTYTIPSTMSIFTGLEPIEHGVLSEYTKLDPQVPLLAEKLQAAGYRTWAFHEGGYVAGRFGFSRGFESYSQLRRLAVVEDRLDSILEWIRSAADDRYFLFLHTYAAHFPYGGFERSLDDGPRRERFSEANVDRWRRLAQAGDLDALSEEELLSCRVFNHLALRRPEMIHGCGHRLPASFTETANFESDRAAMLASHVERIGLIDEAVGRIRDTLIEMDQWDDTLFIVLGDHGEAFFEHGSQRHGYIPFNEVLKVPLIVSYPRLIRDRESHTVDGLVWHLDILPTILSLTGIQQDSTQLKGLDLVPVLTGDSVVPRDRTIHPAVLHSSHVSQEPIRRVALQGDLKYVQGHRLFGDEEGLLFELGTDPGELSNLRPSRLTDFDSLARLSQQHAQALTPGIALQQEIPESTSTEDPGAVALSREAEEQLRELGYIQ